MANRLRVRGVERVVMGDLAGGPRERLIDRLFDLWRGYFLGAERDAFARHWFDEDTHVILTLGLGGDLAGYGYINRMLVDVAGRQHLAMSGGFFTRPEYNGTGTVVAALMRELLRIRLAFPSLPASGVTVATHPIAYDLFERTFAIAAPRQGYDPPPEALVIGHAYARARHLEIHSTDPWMVQLGLRMANTARVLESRAYARRTPAMQLFERRVPRWADGDGLLVWAPLTVSNVTKAMLRATSTSRTRRPMRQKQSEPIETVADAP